MNTLKRTILKYVPPYVACSNAPNAWKDLQKFKNAAILPVYAGSCDNTIYGDAAINVAFRAWHDWIHLQYGLSFTPDNEQQVAAIHALHCDNENDAIVIYADVMSQVEHYQRTGEYSDHQIHTVIEWLEARGFYAQVNYILNSFN